MTSFIDSEKQNTLLFYNAICSMNPTGFCLCGRTYSQCRCEDKIGEEMKLKNSEFTVLEEAIDLGLKTGTDQFLEHLEHLEHLDDAQYELLLLLLDNDTFRYTVSNSILSNIAERFSFEE